MNPKFRNKPIASRRTVSEPFTIRIRGNIKLPGADLGRPPTGYIFRGEFLYGDGWLGSLKLGILGRINVLGRGR